MGPVDERADIGFEALRSAAADVDFGKFMIPMALVVRWSYPGSRLAVLECLMHVEDTRGTGPTVVRHTETMTEYMLRMMEHKAAEYLARFVEGAVLHELREHYRVKGQLFNDPHKGEVDRRHG